MEKDRKANAIVIAAIVVSAPRWAVALLAAEGFGLPAAWLVWWVPLSALLNASMAIVEGLAFSYTFAAWRNQHDKRARWLGALMAASAGVFVIVLAPYIAANVRHEPLSVTLAPGWASLLWAAAVALSTIMIVVSVGYAQKADAPASERRPGAYAKAKQPAPEYVPVVVQAPPEHMQTECTECGALFENKQQKAAHIRWTHRNGHKVIV